MEKKINIALAAGGTGGHIFPAISLAKELKRRGYEPVIISDKRYKSYEVTSKYDIKNEILPLGHLRSGLLNKIKASIQLVFSFFKAIKILKSNNIKCVIGFGGYPSFPSVKAAQFLGIKTIIHEQNSILGRANKMLLEKVNALAISFHHTIGFEDKYKSKIYYTGNPIRPEIQALSALPYPDFNDNSKLHILVTGGSQGAKIFAKTIPNAIKLLPFEFKRRVRLDQQCRPEDLENVKRLYNEMDIDAELSTFFSDIPNRIASAHLIICRSGASSLAEASASGRPLIMVPLPNSKDNHQMVNAIAFEDIGAGIVIPQDSFTPENLALKIENFFRLPELLTNMAKSSKASGVLDADKKLCDIVEEVIKQEKLV
ncbi:MAG: undecaprenyldiphospho-muramoylpentapeptide beta-N-acetylglucosaminyltransferase [Rickettsiales bacterium]|nr:undecaprenyldiphospho-muramoylpentapeptide beta-N-acetylglucosaminyltransferase [Rickettsiales bacterium]